MTTFRGECSAVHKISLIFMESPSRLPCSYALLSKRETMHVKRWRNGVP